MTGLRFRLVRDTPEGPVDKTLYLATRRTGEAGKAMREAKREFYRLEFACARAAQRYQAADARVRGLAPGDPGQEAAVEKRDALLDQIRETGENATDAAERMVRLSLTANYGADGANDLLDQLTDKEVRAMVSVIETGELPADFFGEGAARPRPTTISPSGATPPEPSSKPDSAAKTSSGAA